MNTQRGSFKKISGALGAGAGGAMIPMLVGICLTTTAGVSVSTIGRRGKESVLRKVLTREVVADLARLSEAAMMYDLSGDVWADARTTAAGAPLSKPLMSREQSVFFAPTAVDGYTERRKMNARSCEVRLRSARCVQELCSKYAATFVEWIDTGEGTEKQAVVLRLNLEGRNVLLIAWRGSKTFVDWAKTDTSMQFVRLQPAKTDGAWPPIFIEPEQESRHRFMPLLARSPAPCVARGMWRAYAGKPGRTRAGSSPRARVLRAVEAELAARPDSLILTTGHSMGGTLATICAYDLLSGRSLVRGQCVACITFGSSRSFNTRFRRRMDELQRAGQLLALRVINHGDIVPRIPFFLPFGCVHCIRPRLLLNPRSVKQPLAFSASTSPRDGDLPFSPPLPSDAHVLHSTYLSAVVPAGGRRPTLSGELAWPLSDRVLCATVWHCLAADLATAPLTP